MGMRCGYNSHDEMRVHKFKYVEICLCITVFRIKGAACPVVTPYRFFTLVPLQKQQLLRFLQIRNGVPVNLQHIDKPKFIHIFFNTQRRNKMSRIGLQMYTMRGYVKTLEDYKTTVTKVAEIGYKVLQMTRPAFMELSENVAFLNSLGLKADSVFKPWDKVIPEIADAVKEAEAYGCDVLRTNSIPDEMRIKGADGYREFARLMNESGKVCKDAGLRYMYHFHAFEWITFGKERGIDILLNETDPELVYFYPDVFWLTNAGTEPSVSLRMFKGRAFTMHVKDYAIKQLEGVIENVPYYFASVGEGNLNWDGIMKTANDIGIERFVVEQDMCSGDVFEAIKTSYNSLRKMGLE